MQEAPALCIESDLSVLHHQIILKHHEQQDCKDATDPTTEMLTFLNALKDKVMLATVGKQPEMRQGSQDKESRGV